MHINSPKEVFKPTTLEAIGYFVFNLILLALANIGLIVQKITSDVPIDPAEFQKSFMDQIQIVGINKFVKIATIVIFWSLIGLVVYTIFWVFLNFITGLKNEVVIETDYVNKAKFSQRIKIPLIKFGFIVLILLFVVLSLRYFYPAWISFVRQFIFNIETTDLQTTGLMLIGLTGAWINTYIVVTLYKLLRSVDD